MTTANNPETLTRAFLVPVGVSKHPPAPINVSTLAEMAVSGLSSASSRRNYTREIKRYIESGQPLNREGVQKHLQSLRTEGAGPVTLNVALAAIRMLAREASVRYLLDDGDMNGIERIKGAKQRGVRAGNWLQLAQLQLLIEHAAKGPNGARNAALLACMAGCGLRRAEVCALTWDQWQRREGRWCWVDLEGKGNRVRTVPVSDWVAELVNRWKETEPGNNRVFNFGPQYAYTILLEVAQSAGLGKITPHDLRRTYAKLSRDGGASLEQVQATLGHTNLQTTQRYLGSHLELKPGEACGDHIKLPRKD